MGSEDISNTNCDDLLSQFKTEIIDKHFICCDISKLYLLLIILFITSGLFITIAFYIFSSVFDSSISGMLYGFLILLALYILGVDLFCIISIARKYDDKKKIRKAILTYYDSTLKYRLEIEKIKHDKEKTILTYHDSILKNELEIEKIKHNK